MRCAIASANFASLPHSVSQRGRIPVEETGEAMAKTVPDQLIINGIVGDGTVVSFQIRDGMNRGMACLFEIHGDQGDLQLTATSTSLYAAAGTECERGSRG